MRDLSLPPLVPEFSFQWIRASKRRRNEDAKLMIVLHGLGDSADSFARFDEELEMPEFNYLLLNAPDPHDDGYSWYRLEPHHRPGVLRARQKLFVLVESLLLQGWQSRQIYFLGHSQGALMVTDFLLNHWARFGGAIGVSGYVWFFRGWQKKARYSSAARTPLLMTYGFRDRQIPPEETRADVQRLQSAGLLVKERGFSKGHDFDFQSEVPYLRRWLKGLEQTGDGILVNPTPRVMPPVSLRTPNLMLQR